ncbi:MAG: hypothetical protein U1F77_15325 [Kiritimatiellia bacterium]
MTFSMKVGLAHQHVVELDEVGLGVRPRGGREAYLRTLPEHPDGAGQAGGRGDLARGLLDQNAFLVQPSSSCTAFWTCN